jgi:hypothetical protein
VGGGHPPSHTPIPPLQWCPHIGPVFTTVCCKGSPHYFRICQRSDIGFPFESHGHDLRDELQVPIDDFPAGIPRDAGDIMLVIKHYMASRCIAQVIAVCPSSRVASIRTGTLQPAGVACRRAKNKADMDSLRRETTRALENGYINADAAAYLIGYSDDSLPRQSRPERYDFLEHRYAKKGAGPVSVKSYPGMEGLRGMKIEIGPVAAGVDGCGEALPLEGEAPNEDMG